MPLADVVDLLACPACAGNETYDAGLSLDDGTLRCPAGHAYDLARQGYANLAGRASPRHADTAAMVAARERVLDSGAYDRVADALFGALEHVDQPFRAVLEVGAGPGWYLTRVLDGLTGPARGVALDVSAVACRRAAVRAGSRRLGAVVGDVWARLPLRSGSADAVLNVFAPRNPAEFARVLRPGGLLVVTAPQPDHLRGLREVLGLLDVQPGKQERLDAAFAGHLEPVGSAEVRYALPVTAALVTDLVAMGPNAFHTPPDALAGRVRATALPDEVDVVVRIGVWRRPSGAHGEAPSRSVS